MKNKRIPLIIIVLFCGLFVGSLFGDLASRFLPDGFIKKLFFETVAIGIKEPLKLDLSFFYIVFGGVLKINFFSLLGLLIASIFAYRIKK
ncbi:MAG: DUF4321 domain-containing protein [Acidobacteria bacterium]|nr:DUF4321 domain-containing protein [Acidobacteriota bacterium]